MNITYYDKDKNLSYLIKCDTVYPHEHSMVDFEEMQETTGYSPRLINAILEGFQEEGLISNLNLRFSSPSFFLEVHQSAFDLFNRGGFTMKENILQKEIEKLLLEVERLKPSLGDKVERITTIISNIANIIKPF